MLSFCLFRHAHIHTHHLNVTQEWSGLLGPVPSAAVWDWMPLNMKNHMAVFLTLHLCVIRPAACKKTIKKKAFDIHNWIPTWPRMLFNEFSIAGIVQHLSRWQTERRNAPRLHYNPPPRPRQRFQHLQTALLPIQGRFQLCHGTHYSIALWGCRRLHHSAAGYKEAMSADPGAKLLTCRVFQHSTGQWPVREVDSASPKSF